MPWQIYTCKHTHTHTYIRTYIHTYIPILICNILWNKLKYFKACNHVCIYTYMLHIHTYIHTYIHGNWPISCSNNLCSCFSLHIHTLYFDPSSSNPCDPASSNKSDEALPLLANLSLCTLAAIRTSNCAPPTRTNSQALAVSVSSVCSSDNVASRMQLLVALSSEVTRWCMP